MVGPSAHEVSRSEELLHNLAAIRARVSKAAELAGRTDRVTILPISKYHTVEDIKMVMDLGVRKFGENIHQSALSKINALKKIPHLPFPAEHVQWHMVGQIQSKKARAIARWASAVHSVDRLKIVTPLAQGAQQAHEEDDKDSPLSTYVQVSLDNDPSRGGASSQEFLKIAEEISNKPSLKLEGLMVVPPADWENERAFALAADFRENLLTEFPQAVKFSAGMTADLETAIKYGSTCVRVGTAIFGEKTLISNHTE